MIALASDRIHAPGMSRSAKLPGCTPPLRAPDLPCQFRTVPRVRIFFTLSRCLQAIVPGLKV
jgi:hypothetical protein